MYKFKKNLAWKYIIGAMRSKLRNPILCDNKIIKIGITLFSKILECTMYKIDSFNPDMH